MAVKHLHIAFDDNGGGGVIICVRWVESITILITLFLLAAKIHIYFYIVRCDYSLVLNIYKCCRFSFILTSLSYLFDFAGIYKCITPALVFMLCS